MLNTTELTKEINRQGMQLTLRKAKRNLTCVECRKPIEAGSQYYQIYHTGSGVDAHPSRIHADEVEKFFSEHDDNGYRRVFPWYERGE
jgi:hypothetical protein